MLGTPSPRQFRAARAWLGWSMIKAAEEAGVSTFVIRNLEKAQPVLSPNQKAVRAAYEATGLLFVSFDGIAKRPG